MIQTIDFKMSDSRDYFAQGPRVRAHETWLAIVAILACRIVNAEGGLTNDVRMPAAPVVRQLATLANADILESSGLAVSLTTPHRWWTHNDSGDGPRLFAFDDSGRDVGVVTLVGVTAIDVSPDGTRAIVLTYGDAYEFQRRGAEPWADAFQRQPQVIEMPVRKQGESICYAADSRSLFLTSERQPTPLWIVERAP